MRRVGIALSVAMLAVFAGNVFVQDAKGEDVLVQYGNLDGSPIAGHINSSLAIDVYLQTSEDVYAGDLHLCLGSDDQYIDDHLSETEGQIYYPLSEWAVAVFTAPEGSPPNPEGWSSQSFVGIARLGPGDEPWLHLETPTKIMTFVFKIVNDEALIGQTVECLGQGINEAQGPSNASDTMGYYPFDIAESYSPVQFIDPAAGNEVIIGNIDGSLLEAYSGEIFDIPVWIKSNRSVGNIHIPLSTNDQYVSARLGGMVFSPLNGWDYADFEPPDEDQPETGFTSQSLLARTDLSADPGSFLNTNGSYWKIAEFTVQISSNPSIVGDVIQFSEGYHPGMEGVIFGEDTGHYHRAFASIESDVIILSSVSLDCISGIGNITYMGEGISVRPSLTILSTMYTVGDMFFIEITDEYDYVVYTNTIYSRPIAEGTNVIEFDTDWVITSPGTYEAFAEGFRDPVRAGFYEIDEDGEDPTWAIVCNDKYRSPNCSIALLGAGTESQFNWLIQGPVDLSAYVEPVIYFWEDERYWGEFEGESHEFYVSIGPFDIEGAKLDGPILTHTPENHYILGFTDDSLLIELYNYGGNDSVYFAWRYVSNGDHERHQWFIDNITWADMGYIPGDVNGDCSVIGSDVTYLVAYFVSGGPPPNPVEAGDVNGDCSLIGSDVTYLVAYFVSGGPAPVRGNCP